MLLILVDDKGCRKGDSEVFFLNLDHNSRM